VSHQPQRREKDCLNCGTIVQGHYCHVCGQENIVTHQNFGGLTKHFIYDIFHFDGKFFDTLKHLLFKPGLVAKEYVKGKRAKYLDPIRMYLFTSAVFFVFFFSVAQPDMRISSTPQPYLTNKQRLKLLEDLQKKTLVSGDSNVLKDIAVLKDTTRKVKREQVLSLPNEPIIHVYGSEKYRSVEEYDSIQSRLRQGAKDNWLKKKLVKKGIVLNSKYSGNAEGGLRKFWENFLHQLPYALFISLPFFALILKMLYSRRKSFYYSDHAIFTLYHYIFSFLILLVIFGVDGLRTWLNWSVFDWLLFSLIVFWFYYLYRSLLNFYEQNIKKTIGKFLLLNFLGFVTILLLSLIFLFLSIFQL